MPMAVRTALKSRSISTSASDADQRHPLCWGLRPGNISLAYCLASPVRDGTNGKLELAIRGSVQHRPSVEFAVGRFFDAPGKEICRSTTHRGRWRLTNVKPPLILFPTMPKWQRAAE